MQPLAILTKTLKLMSSETVYLFSNADIRPVFPTMSDSAFRMLLNRANRSGLLIRLCRNLYLYPDAPYPRAQLLYFAAAKLRANAFNYISLESQLSDSGVISQMPINYLTIMTTGRKSTFDLGEFGTIEFTHSHKRYEKIAEHLIYDPAIRFFRANKQLAYDDLCNVGRNLDLVDLEELAHE